MAQQFVVTFHVDTWDSIALPIFRLCIPSNGGAKVVSHKNIFQGVGLNIRQFKEQFNFEMHSLYQNFTYNAKIINSVTTIRTVVDGFNLNISLSNSNAFGFILGPAMLMAIIRAIVKKKARPMQI